MASIEAARPSHGTLANWRAESQAALYQILGLSPGYRCANSVFSRASRWLKDCPGGIPFKARARPARRNSTRAPLAAYTWRDQMHGIAREQRLHPNLRNGMATKLDKTIKRELELDGKLYTIAISPEGVKVTPKGARKGQEISWTSIVSGETELRRDLNASVDAYRE
jgi:hypothetical protein